MKNTNVETTLIPITEALPVRAELAGLGIEEFERLVVDQQRRVYRVLLGFLRDPELADSLTQECFLRAFRARGSYRGEGAESWLLSIALNLARDHVRSRRQSFWRRLVRITSREPGEPAGPEPTDPAPSAERSLLARERLSAVWSALERLPRRQREVFHLRYLEQLSLGAIAESLGLQVGTVKAHLARAVAAVRADVTGGSR